MRNSQTPRPRLPQRIARWVAAGLWGVTLGLCGWVNPNCAAAELRRFQSTQIEMGVPFKIILYAADESTAKGAFDAAFERIGQLNAVLSDYDPQSELSRLSKTSPAARGVPVSDTLWHVLARSQSLAEATDGAFDVTVGPYVRLWRRARRQKQMPSADRLQSAREAVGYQKLVLDPTQRTARLQSPNMRLDLGGIAMGYAVDEALAALRRRGIVHALVDASGDIGVGDPPPGKQAWMIDVIPLSADGAPTRVIRLANAAVTTSGDAFQHVVIDGSRYSHIVDPRTGLGLTDQSGVTIVARDCLSADSLATAVSALGPRRGLQLIEATPGAAAFIVRNADGRLETFESRRFKCVLAESEE